MTADRQRATAAARSASVGLASGQQDELSYSLPPHKRCASHTLNLVSKDIEKAQASTGDRLTYRSSLAKCSALWNKASRSTVAAEAVEEICKTKLLVPTETRWNSLYDAVSKIVKIGKEHINAVCHKMNINAFTDKEFKYLQDYSEVTKPLAEALDILQGEDHCYYGTLLPVLTTLVRKMEKKKASNSSVQSSLADLIIKSVEKRFATIFEDSDAQLAAVSHPFFKTVWANESGQKNYMRGLLLEEVRKIHAKQSNAERRQAQVQDESDKEEVSFFDFNVDDEAEEVLDEEVEVERFFRESKTIQSLKSYPAILEIFLQKNTTLPSSAPVERLFSLGGQILSPKRNRLSDPLFEKLLVMRYNADYM